ncbi:short-chain dehydrogenase [Dyadobacter luteus]|uniref:Short-chain dehydrogenase n=1 Tax=Dyadobacter luteus TaxID=2259619 RepID=A0A3D8YH36_9BACT|nr:glucose 1-dehydrogenase [Dyadobacter luteus]REA64005.1 short-chain dehydrogenase [Dyadobacter luteus]
MHNNTLFDQQVAVITGASEGIGFEIARQLVINGSHVVLNSLEQDSTQKAAEELNKLGAGRCIAVPGDSSETETIERIVNNATDHFGRIDFGIANTGMTVSGPFLEFKEQDLNRMMQVNIKGTYMFAQAVANRMRDRGTGGSIVLMSSVNAKQANRHLSAYAMTKSAIVMLAKNLVIELSPYNIRINCVAPGATMTQRTMGDQEYENAWSDVTPLGQVATPEDIAAATLFLLSSPAKHITGQTLVIDGGWTATSPTPGGETL